MFGIFVAYFLWLLHTSGIFNIFLVYFCILCIFVHIIAIFVAWSFFAFSQMRKKKSLELKAPHRCSFSGFVSRTDWGHAWATVMVSLVLLTKSSKWWGWHHRFTRKGWKVMCILISFEYFCIFWIFLHILHNLAYFARGWVYKRGVQVEVWQCVVLQGTAPAQH